MRNRWKMSGVALIIGVPLMLSGCGLWGSSSQQADKPKDTNYVSPGDSLNKENGDHKKDKTSKKTDASTRETAKRKLFLVDQNGMVVPQTLEVPVPKGNSVLKQAMQLLVKGGPAADLLPKGFQAVLPKGTKINGINLVDGTATINFSKQFAHYKPDQEKQILQAVTWTATQFDTVDHVKIQIDGVAKTAMPVNGTPIGNDGVSRADGINEQLGEVGDVMGTQAVTLYFPAQSGDHYYYVPVTTRMNADKGKITAVINGLMDGPPLQNGLLDVFGSNVKLKGNPTIQDGIVTLNFNKAIYSSAKQHTISDEALNSLVLSLTSQDGIKKVAIKVDGKASLKNQSGQKISKPVSRPENVNTVGL